MERRNVEYFVAVSEQGSFVRAAYSLNVTQPALSHGVAALERELGVQLFWRKPDGSVLTPAGERILPAARQVLTGLESIATLARDVKSLAVGRLDVAAASAWAVGPVARLVGRLRTAAPGVTVRIHAPQRMVRTEILQLLRDRQAEVAIVGGQDDPTSGDASLVVVGLRDLELLCLVPDAPRFRKSTAIAAAAAVDLGLIVGPWWDDSTARQHIAQQVGQDVDDRVVVRTAYREAVLPLVAAAAGASFALAADQTYDGVLALPFDPPIRLSSFLVYRREALSPAARAFIDLALQDPAL